MMGLPSVPRFGLRGQMKTGSSGGGWTPPDAMAPAGSMLGVAVGGCIVCGGPRGGGPTGPGAAERKSTVKHEA